MKRAMVKALIKQKIEADGDALMGLSEAPDYGGDDGDQLSPEPKGSRFWTLPNWHEIEENLRDIIKKEGIHPVDPVTIASKSNPIPLKDVRDDWLNSISGGLYCGHNSNRKALLQDTFDAMIEGRVRKVSRWAFEDY